MIETGKYKVILEEGLLLDHYVLLCNIRDGAEMLKSKRIQGFINLMCKKGYIDEGVLTEKAMRLLSGENNPIPAPEVLTTGLPVQYLAARLEKSEPELKVERKFDYAAWIIQLHKKCEDRMFEGTGKRQVRDKIDGKPYSFLPNSTDLGRVLLRVVNVYKLKDFDKIEKTILKYIDRCIKANKWFPILGYYIMKNSMSSMVTDMESDEEETTGDNPSTFIV
jgi:hypothetical protein